VKDPANKKASPVGSTEYCLTTKTGNCTDFHSLWTSLARASGIPTRMVYGSFFKAELDGQDADQSYHCWPEFYAPNIGWVPHDVAVADIFAGDFQTTPENEKLVRLTTGDGYHGPDKTKVDYYFGNIDERRVTWSRGRDLVLKPKPDAGLVNALAKGYVEVDGKVHPEKTGWIRKLTFRERK
jgi:transglutaminase-like putative cysteine protease